MRYADGKILGKNGLNKALVYSTQEWDNLLARINEGRQLQERIEDRLAREESRKEMSKKMTANWPNTLANMQKKRQRLLLDAAEKAENDKLKEFNEIMAKRAEEKEAMLENARKLVMQRTESSRTLNSGLVLSEILYERNKQIEMRKIHRKTLWEKELEETARKIKLAEAFREEQSQEKINHLETLQRYKQELDEQMLEINAVRQLEHAEKLREKEDIEDLTKELMEFNETEKIQAVERKQQLREEQKLWKEIKASNMEKKLQEEKEEREMNGIYQTVRDRINKQREELEKKLRRETFEKRAKFAAAHMVPRIDVSREEELMKKAIEDRDAKAKHDDLLKEQKKDLLRRELHQFRAEAAAKAQEQASVKKEMDRWEILKRLAIGESNQKYNEKMYMLKKEQQRLCRESLVQQWEERELREKTEKWDDMTLYENEKIREENALLKLCDEVAKTCADSGRPMYPVLAAIKRVKKQHGIRDGVKKVPFLQSRVPICSVACYKNSQK